MASVFTAAQARASDQFVMSTLGLPGVVLMENAGRGVARVIRRALLKKNQTLANAKVVVVCGAGQNGGDGFVIARHLHLMGARVQVYLVMPAVKIQGDAAVNLRALQGLDEVPVDDVSDVLDEEAWWDWLNDADVLVDAIFGTGLRADVTGVPAVAIAAMNESRALRVAVDVPSGLNADTGRVQGVAVNADVTATMAVRKLGLVVDADAPVGEVVVVGLGAPPHEDPALAPFVRWVEPALVKAWLPVFGAAAHKGTRGHVLLVAGSEGKTGAAAMCGRAALRAGAGLVTVATTKAAQTAVDAKVWEVMSAAFTSVDDATPDSFDVVMRLSSKMKSIGLGPGLPTGPGTAAFVQRMAVQCALPMVIDAEALNHIAADPGVLMQARGPRVLTPHPAEMARLLGVTTTDVQADRATAARTLAQKTQAIVVLKGARTLVALPNGTLYVNPAASPALGTAGSGDVLTGAIAALLAQGLTAEQASVCGVFVHGMAADDACARLGLQHLLAGELPDAFARVQAALQSVPQI